MRLDKALWFLRFAASRSLAQEWIFEGHIRINGRRIEKPGAQLVVGNVITLPLRAGVKVIEVVMLPQRRSPASEAQTCYRVLDVRGPMAIAGGNPGPQSHASEQGEVPQ